MSHSGSPPPSCRELPTGWSSASTVQLAKYTTERSDDDEHYATKEDLPVGTPSSTTEPRSHRNSPVQLRVYRRRSVAASIRQVVGKLTVNLPDFIGNVVAHPPPKIVEGVTAGSIDRSADVFAE